MNIKIFRVLSAFLFLALFTGCSALSSEGIPKPDGYVYKKPTIPFEPPGHFPPEETCPVRCQQYPVPQGCPAVCRVNEEICNGRCLGKFHVKRDISSSRVKCAWVCKFNDTTTTTTTTTTTRRPELLTCYSDICRRNPYSYQCPENCRPTTTTTTRRPEFGCSTEICRNNPYSYQCPEACRPTTTTRRPLLAASEEEEDIQSQGHAPPPKQQQQPPSCSAACKANPYGYNCPATCRLATTTTTEPPGCPDICYTNPYSYSCPVSCRPAATTTTTRRPESVGCSSEICRNNPYSFQCPQACRPKPKPPTYPPEETCPVRCQQYPVPQGQGCPAVCRVNEDICNGRCLGKIHAKRDTAKVKCAWVCKFNETTATTTTTRRPEFGCSTEICRTNPYSYQCPAACRPTTTTTTRRPEFGCPDICRTNPYAFTCPANCRPITTTTRRPFVAASEEEEDIQPGGYTPPPKQQQPSCSAACKANPYSYNCPPDCRLPTTTTTTRRPDLGCPSICRTNPYSFSCPTECRQPTTTTTTRRPEFGCPSICRTNPYSYQCPANCRPTTTTTRKPIYVNEEEEDILAAGQRPPPKQSQNEDAEHKIGDPFDFTYAVNDDERGTHFTRQEQSKDDVVTGEYRVLMPDGRTQIVRYTADWKNGFRSHITYEGQISYQQQGRN